MKRTVNICGIPHTVILQDDNFTASGQTLGEIHYKTAEIFLATGQSPEIEKETLCHEMMHGILLHIGETELCDDEGFVTKIAAAVSQAFDPIIKVEKRARN